MKTRFAVTLLLALAALGAIFGSRLMKDRRAAAAQAQRVMPPVTVSAAAVAQVTWPNTLRAVGTLASFRGVTVKNELEGLVSRVAFKSGAIVPEGAVLVELDTSVETAQLAGLKSQARLAELNVARARELRTNNTNSQVDLDTAEAAWLQARSAVDQLRATLAKKRILAPFAGRLGITRIYPGQFLGKADAIVDLETLDPIYADFTLPQQEVGRVAVGQAVRVRVDAHPGRVFEGRIEAIEPRVNDATRSLTLRAAVPNRDEALLPGMFGNIEILLGGEEQTLALPTAAIVYNPYGNFVYVIEQGVAHQRFVQTGRHRGNQVAVLSGVKAGEQIVTSGQIKLRNGSPVRVDNSAAPSANPAPTPTEG